MKFFQKTDIGLKRENNEDAVGVFNNKTNQPLATIADGMGGHLGGDIASNIALLQIGASFEETSDLNSQDFIKWINYELFKVNGMIIKEADDSMRLYGMGTTFASVFIDNKNNIVFSNLGDTRGYLYRNGILRQITDDQTLVNELLKKGELSKEEAENFPNRNIITSSLGVDKKVDPLHKVISLEGGEIILLSSDGLTNMVSDEFISQKLATFSDPKQLVDDLVQEAIKNGGYDNISVIIGINDERSE